MSARPVRPVRSVVVLAWICTLALPVLSAPPLFAQDATEAMRLAIVEGHLGLEPDNHLADDEFYTVTFHVPVETEHQVPLKLVVESRDLLDSRLLRTTNSNLIGVARVSARAPTLDWRAWVLIEPDRIDRPTGIPVSALADLPDSTLPYLQATATAQVDCQPVQQWAQDHAWMTQADLIAGLAVDRAAAIPYEAPSTMAFDAYTALTLNSTCTGHAHAATALLRAMGIPARTKLSMIYNYGNPYDMHWTIDLFLPGAGWIGVESTVGTYPYSAQGEVVMYCCDPADEFPLYYVNGIDAHWHNSDPAFTTRPPAWGGGALFVERKSVYATGAEREELMRQARLLLRYEVAYRGSHLTLEQAGRYAAARLHVDEMIDALNLRRSPSEAIAALDAALGELGAIPFGDRVTLYATSFEEDVLDWAHGGVRDAWEWGTPQVAELSAARTGAKAWGTDLDGDYPHGSDCWLQSPPIDLDGLIAAQIQFWVWNQTQGGPYNAQDYLCVEIARDGGAFEPIVGRMAGTNDDPSVPEVTGWARCDADLTPWVGGSVRLRFRFHSDVWGTYAGSFLDDVMVTGRVARPSPVVDQAPASASIFARAPGCFPNPFNPRTRITFSLAAAAEVSAAIYDLKGRCIARLSEGPAPAGEQILEWEGTDDAGRAVAAGNYVLRVRAGSETAAGKLVLVR